jgi:hypothetical protein
MSLPSVNDVVVAGAPDSFMNVITGLPPTSENLSSCSVALVFTEDPSLYTFYGVSRIRVRWHYTL